jgi:uncharacterized protein
LIKSNPLNLYQQNPTAMISVSRSRIFLCLVLALASFLSMNASTYEENELKWRLERSEHLTAPDGWLSLIGLHWLSPGKNTIGSSNDNSIQLNAGPAHFGCITLAENKTIIFESSKSGIISVGGKPSTAPVIIKPDDENPLIIQSGSVSFFVIIRGDKIGIRVKDTESERRKHFVGCDYYPINSAWRIEAAWIDYQPPHSINITNVLGQTSPEPVPGKAVFKYEGKTYELTPIDEGKNEPLFFIIRDKTSGIESYGASRFLYADRPRNGIIILDFNRAENPPCAFTPYATCPLPPKENNLPLAITAGEKSYKGESH